MMLECFFASESVSSSDALKFGLFFIHSRHFPAHLTTNFRSAIKSGAGETTDNGVEKQQQQLYFKGGVAETTTPQQTNNFIQ